jgi:hypothetical protein
MKNFFKNFFKDPTVQSIFDTIILIAFLSACIYGLNLLYKY